MNRIEFLCNRIIQTGFIVLAFMVPLFFTPLNYELFEYNKMMVTYGITAVIGCAWMSKMIAQKSVYIAKTPFNIPIGIFIFFQFVSALFSMDPYVSWFGYYSRFNGGVASIICYAILFFACVSNVKKEWLPALAKATIGSAVLVSLYGILEHFGIDQHIWVQDVQARVFSTLGQPNWLAAYLVVLIPLAFFASPLVSFIVSTLFFITLLFTRSRSGLAAFTFVDILFSIILFIKSKRATKIHGLAVNLLFVMCLLLFGTGIPQIDNVLKKSQTPIPAVTQNTGPVLESGGTESGIIRKYVWQGAINTWNANWKNRLIGTGTETFAFAFYQFRPTGHNLTSEWDFLYNKAHNEYLNFLATTGIFGLGSYLLLIGAIIYWFIKNIMVNGQWSQKFQIEQSNSIIIGLFCGWLSLLITNFFGFSVVVTQLLFFLLPAAAYVQHIKNPELRMINIKLYEKTQHMALLVTFSLTILFCTLLALTWYADSVFASGFRLSRSGEITRAYPALSRAVSLNPFIPLYHDEYGSTLSSLALAADESGDATLSATLAAAAIAENERALTISPNNVTYWKTRTKILYTLSTFDDQYLPYALSSLEKAQLLSPRDPKIVYNLAILSGKIGMPQKATLYLQDAIALKPNYRDAYYALYVFYKEEGNKEKAESTIRQYLTTVDSRDEEFTKLVE